MSLFPFGCVGALAAVLFTLAAPAAAPLRPASLTRRRGLDDGRRAGSPLGRPGHR